MVSEVSAIEVASTTLRRPFGAGAMARSCSRGVERAEQRHDLDRRRRESARASNVLGAADFARARQEHQHRARLGAQRHRDRIRHLPLDAAHRPRGRDSASRPERRGLRSRSPAHRRAASRRARRRASPTSPGCADPRAGPPARRAPAPGPRSASSERSWNSSNSTAATPVSSGSSRIMPREDALGDDLDARRARDLRAEADAEADGLADALAQRLRHALGAARAASRRGSSTMIFLPCSQGSSSSASGTRVVLPAPGGATSTAALLAAQRARQAGPARRRSGAGCRRRGARCSSFVIARALCGRSTSSLSSTTRQDVGWPWTSPAMTAVAAVHQARRDITVRGSDARPTLS